MLLWAFLQHLDHDWLHVYLLHGVCVARIGLPMTESLFRTTSSVNILLSATLDRLVGEVGAEGVRTRAVRLRVERERPCVLVCDIST